MSRRRSNTQMFALPAPPPERIEMAGAAYRRVKVFKHDFFAATCLYEIMGLRFEISDLKSQTSEDYQSQISDFRSQIPDAPCRSRLQAGEAPEPPAQAACRGKAGSGAEEIPNPKSLIRNAFPKIVIKFGRVQPFCGIPGEWYGRLLHDHERSIYSRLAGVKGVPRWAGSLSETAYAIEYVDAAPLDHIPKADVPPALFDRLAELLRTIHERGVAYCDMNKRSNILVRAEEVFLVDYQISFATRDEWPWPLAAMVRSAVRHVQASDLYHLYKHKRRICPDALTPEEQALSRRRSVLHTIHRSLTDPWRALRRRFLRAQFEKGRLASPTAELEDHHQPEKATWRKGQGLGTRDQGPDHAEMAPKQRDR